jgi:hypothetical protein
MDFRTIDKQIELVLLMGRKFMTYDVKHGEFWNLNSHKSSHFCVQTLWRFISSKTSNSMECNVNLSWLFFWEHQKKSRNNRLACILKVCYVLGGCPMTDSEILKREAHPRKGVGGSTCKIAKTLSHFEVY